MIVLTNNQRSMHKLSSIVLLEVLDPVALALLVVFPLFVHVSPPQVVTDTLIRKVGLDFQKN